MPDTNGTAVSPEQVHDTLTGQPLTQGYQPSLPPWALSPDGVTPQLYLLRDIELMITHQMVRASLGYFKSGIYCAEFDGGPDPANPRESLPICKENPDANAFILDHCQRYWQRGVPLLQGGYDYGWIGAENVYRDDEDRRLSWDHLLDFSPRDTFLLTRDRRPIGVRVKNIQDTSARTGGIADLFLASADVPAKGLWYIHNPRYNSFYGQSQLLGCWRPWKRLAGKDAAETVVDTGVYRFAFSGPEVAYPEEEIQTAQSGTPATIGDSQGRPRRSARDIARQIAEQAKAGAGYGYPSTNYGADMGGGPKWRVKWPEHVLNVDPLVNYIKYLQDQISYGVGVPPELLQASETGSGYSGRAIPMEAFITAQQRIADALLHLFVVQVLRPLVRWNFGNVRWNARVKPLMESRRKAQGQETPGAKTGHAQRPEEPPPENILPGARPSSTPGPTPPPTMQPPVPGGAFAIDGRYITPRVLQIAQRVIRRAA